MDFPPGKPRPPGQNSYESVFSMVFARPRDEVLKELPHLYRYFMEAHYDYPERNR